MNLVIANLFEHPGQIPFVARTIYDEFWSDGRGYSEADLRGYLERAISADAIPLSLIALVGGEPAGTINLIDNDDAQRTHLHPWLAALVVLPEHRGRGIGSELVRRLIADAARLGHDEVYLGTTSPAFYERLGASQLEWANEELVIMRLPTRR